MNLLIFFCRHTIDVYLITLVTTASAISNLITFKLTRDKVIRFGSEGFGMVTKVYKVGIIIPSLSILQTYSYRTIEIVTKLFGDNFQIIILPPGQHLELSHYNFYFATKVDSHNSCFLKAMVEQNYSLFLSCKPLFQLCCSKQNRLNSLI